MTACEMHALGGAALGVIGWLLGRYLGLVLRDYVDRRAARRRARR